jgi:hypothetical protein
MMECKAQARIDQIDEAVEKKREVSKRSEKRQNQHGVEMIPTK